MLLLRWAGWTVHRHFSSGHITNRNQRRYFGLPWCRCSAGRSLEPTPRH